MDIVEYNSKAWDKQVEKKNEWTIPVGIKAIEEATKGNWEIFLTPTKSVPQSWFPDLKKCNVLCLASGGGQQGPILAAAGAKVTVFDNSEKQLEQDRYVAERDDLELSTVKGDMRDLGIFPDESFDLIIHPVSNLFVPDIRPVWKEASRVLRKGGSMLSGFLNPAYYIFDHFKAEREGVLEIKHKLPYSDAECLSEAEKEKLRSEGFPFEFSHTLEDQIGGQADAGFVITGIYEDVYSPETNDPLSEYMPPFIATRAMKQ